MRLITTSSAAAILLMSLLGVTGCSSSAQTHAITVADTSSDPSWTPPGEMDVAINSTSRESTRTSVANAESMPQPNRREVVKHQLHAAY